MNTENTATSMSDDLATKYRQILNLFTAVKHLYNRPLGEPFIQGQYAIASDGHTLIAFNKSKLKNIDFVPYGNTPNALSIITPPDNTKVVMDVAYLRSRITQLHDDFKERYTYTKRTCPDCHGYGEVEFKFTDFQNTTHEHSGTCPTCEGTGNIEVFTHNKTSKDIYEPIDRYLVYKGAAFEVNNFNKILRVADAFNQSTISLVYYTSDTSFYRFNVGDCIVGIMPVINISTNDVAISIN